MKQNSILIALDGSEESQNAAELAWSLAKVHNSRVVAQTVVDTAALWRIFGQDRPGFIGSGPYLAAYESARSCLQSAAELLLIAYKTRAEAQGIETECFIDEGDIVDQISRRGEEHDLIIVGHKLPAIPATEATHPRFARLSLGERLIHNCDKPLLLVGDRCQLWQSAKFVVTTDGYDYASLKAFLKFSIPLGIHRQIYCVATEESVGDTVLDVRSLVPHQERRYVIGRYCSQLNHGCRKALDVSADTLAVVPLTSDADGNKLCFGEDASTFAGALNLPAVLFLPVQTRTAGSPASYYGNLTATA